METIKSILKPTLLALAIALIGSFTLVPESWAQQEGNYITIPSGAQSAPSECYDENDTFMGTVHLDPNGGYPNFRGLNQLRVVADGSPPSGYVELDDYLDENEHVEFSETNFFIVRDDGDSDCEEDPSDVPAETCNYCTEDYSDPCYDNPSCQGGGGGGGGGGAGEGGWLNNGIQPSELGQLK